LKFEVIGILAAVQLSDGWQKFLNESFLEFLHNNLATGIVEDDIILETLMLISNIAQTQKTAEILYSKKMSGI
jgi:Kinesin-associated protein (KAP)